ncbi:MAG TPA: CBS domain-containing protein [Thermoanaerobaculia bacterium]|jgi:acetoin utilization protein AcuB
MIRLRDIMQKNVERISPNESAEAAWNRMRLRRIRHLVVQERGRVVGVLSDRDVAGRGSLRQVEAVGDVMTEPVVSAHPEMTLRQAANRMRGRSIGCLPVIDGDDLVGIVTTTDLLELLGRGLARIPVRGRGRKTLAARGPRRKPFVAPSLRA